MAYYPDMGTDSLMAGGPFVRAIGWLSRDHAYSLGDVSPQFLQRLKLFASHWGDSTSALGWGVY